MSNNLPTICFHSYCQDFSSSNFCSYICATLTYKETGFIKYNIICLGLKLGQPDWHGVDQEEIEDEVEKRVPLPHRQGNLKL